MTPSIVIIAPNSWEKLPADIQKIFEDTSSQLVEDLINMDIGEIDRAVNTAKEMGHTITYLTPQEIQAWKTLSAPLAEEWIKEMEGKGKPARAIYNDTMQLIASVR